MSEASIVDTRAAEPILGPRLPEIRRQLEELVGQHKRGDVLQITVSPSAVEGRGFMPVMGYAAEFLPSARFIPEHYDLQNLFRGRCVLLLCSGRPPRNLDVTRALELFMEAKRKLVKKFNESAGGAADTMSLRRSPEFSNRYSLLKEPLSGDYYLVVETQMLPALSETEQVDISTYITRLVRRSSSEVSIQDAFIKKQHELGRFLKRYYNAQRRFREMLTKALASRLREAIGAAASPPGERLQHILTNTVNLNGDGRVIFYSEMFEASLPGGALMMAGPFRSALWVTSEAMAGERVLASNRLRALPYDAPHRDDLTALQGIFERRAGSAEGRDARFAEAVHGATWSVFSHSVIRPDLKALNVTIPSMSSLVKLQAEGASINGDLVIGYSRRAHGLPSLPKVSCQEDTEYMVGFDHQGMVAALRTLGVDLSQYGSNYLLFFLDPEFVVQKGDDCRSRGLLATVALPS